MSGTPFPRLGRLAAEFSVIVVGVLVALVLESWWSEREERRFEAELRDDMVAEFEANLLILAADMAANDTIRALSQEVVDLSDPALLAMPESAFARWRDPNSYRWSLFDPYMGSAQALVQSGNLGVLSDRQLRLRLSEWAGLLDEKIRYGGMATNALFREIFPAVADFDADGVWSPDERRKFRTLTEQQIFVTDLVTMNHERLQRAAEEILRYLESG